MNLIIDCRIVPPVAWVEATELALVGSDTQRQTIVLTLMKQLLQQGKSGQLLVVRGEGKEGSGDPVCFEAAAVFVLASQTSANLIAFGARSAKSGIEVAGGETSDVAVIANAASPLILELIEFAHQELRDRRIPFVQALRGGEIDDPLLKVARYQRLADLDYLVGSTLREPIDIASDRAIVFAELRESIIDVAAEKQALVLMPYRQWFNDRSGENSSQLGRELVGLVDATYEGSQDCPAIAEFQAAEEVLVSYSSSTDHRAEWWYVALDQRQQVIGCLLLTPRPTADLIEVTYMGLVPAARGNGWGGELLRAARQKGREAGLGQIALAVDHANRPAQRLYQRHELELLFRESVWGYDLRKTS